MAIKDKKLNILFVCKYNRFRSRVAKAYFDEINKNKNIRTKSAGAIKGKPVSKPSIKTAKRLGLDIRGKTNGLSTDLLIWQDMTIIVADDVPPIIFSNNKKYGKKVIVWKIKDIPSQEGTEAEKKKLIKKIMKKVDGLNKNLQKELK